MVFSQHHDYKSPIVGGMRVHINFEPGVKLRDGTRDAGTYHCRVVGNFGWRRVVGVMLTDITNLPERSTAAFIWAAREAIEVALLRSAFGAGPTLKPVAVCRDGKTYSNATGEHRGACSGHGGVASWTDGSPVRSHGKSSSYK